MKINKRMKKQSKKMHNELRKIKLNCEKGKKGTRRDGRKGSDEEEKEKKRTNTMWKMEFKWRKEKNDNKGGNRDKEAVCNKPGRGKQTKVYEGN